MLTHAFEHWGVKRITMTTNSRDDRSRQSIERLGASLDGVMRAARPCPENIDGDIAVYTIIDSEWPTVRTRLQMAVQQQTMKHIISLDSSLAATHV
jgi:RimJ/RimL family protein N-acetyltransferase